MIEVGVGAKSSKNVSTWEVWMKKAKKVVKNKKTLCKQESDSKRNFGFCNLIK